MGGSLSCHRTAYLLPNILALVVEYSVDIEYTHLRGDGGSWVMANRVYKAIAGQN